MEESETLSLLDKSSNPHDSGSDDKLCGRDGKLFFMLFLKLMRFRPHGSFLFTGKICFCQ